LVGELKGDEGRWEEVVLGWGYGVAELVLHELDQELMKGREEGLRVKGFKERCLTKVFGDVRIRRRVYMDKAGRRRCLLDEAISLRKGDQTSPMLKGWALFLSSHLSFGKCEQILSFLVPGRVSHPSQREGLSIVWWAG
jgi:hypothetical protein